MKFVYIFLAFLLAAVRGEETVFDAARIARELIESSSVGTLSTVYPPGHELAGQAIGLMEYYAPCYSNGSLTILFFGISRNGRNILASSNHSATFSVQAPTSYSPATKPRLALMGSVTLFPREYSEGNALKACYLRSHPDASWWVPGNKAGVHDSVWAIFNPHEVYYVGGFGGLHYIGPIPIDIYKDAIPKAPTMRIQAERL